MVRSLLRLLRHRRLSPSPQNLKPYSYYHSSLCAIRGFRPANSKPFSTAPSAPSPDPPKPSNLSARLSFVFDQIDKIERERSQKDETLQRIRAWRESKNAQLGSARNAEMPENSPNNESQKEPEQNPPRSDELTRSQAGGENKVELVHPWPEWIELMEQLVRQNYFDHKRRDEGSMVSALGFDVGEDIKDGEGFDFTRDLKTVQTAGLNFGKDRFDILRSLSRQDIQILVGYGCPSADKKVVFSAKLLRKLVHLDEGDVCSSCSLRNTCERAYLVTNKEDEARTVDVMRVLMAFGFDHMHETVTNKHVLKQKSVKTVVRKLLHEVVKLSSVPIDPNLPPPIIKRAPPKVKQPPPPPKKRVGRDDIEMKKGDWLCPKCGFMNFAKNAVCLQCDAKRPKRQLLPGEWECPECNFLNYRRNVVCFHCECKRPPDQFMEDRLQDTRPNPRTTGLEKAARRTEISNAWNFDFDDDESDGADVAAFEYADSTVAGKGSPSERNYESPEEDFHRGSRLSKACDAEYSDFEEKGSGVGFDGFDDFDDEDDDDVDSYELDSTRSNVPTRDFSEFEQESESEDGGLAGDELLHRSRAQTRFSPKKPSKSTRQRVAFSGSNEGEFDFGSDEELSNWRSSHVADSGIRNGARGLRTRRLSHGSDEELDRDSDDDDDFGERIGSMKSKTSNFSGKRRESSRLFSGSEESDDDNFSSRKSTLKGKKGGGGDKKRGSNFKGSDSRNFAQDVRSRSNGGMGDRRRNYAEDDFKKDHSQGFRGGRRGGYGDQKRGRGGSSRFGLGGRMAEDDFGRRQHVRSRNYDEGRGDGDQKRGRGGSSRLGLGGRMAEDDFRRRQHGRSRNHDEGRGGDDDFRNRRRVIER